MRIHRWTNVIGLIACCTSFTLIAAPRASVETVAINLPNQPISPNTSVTNTPTVIASAQSTSVLPNANNVSQGQNTNNLPPIPVTVNGATSASPETPPANSKATAVSPSAKPTPDINSLPLPQEFTPEQAAAAVSSAHESPTNQTNNKAAGGGVPQQQVTVPAAKSSPSSAPIAAKPQAMSGKSAITSKPAATTSQPSKSISSPAPITNAPAKGASAQPTPTSQVPAITPSTNKGKQGVSTNVVAPTSGPASSNASVNSENANDAALTAIPDVSSTPATTQSNQGTEPDYTKTDKPSEVPEGAYTPLTGATGTNANGLIDSSDIDTTSAMVDNSSKAAQEAVKKAGNPVSAQELAWELDQPNPSKGPNAIPLMLTNPDPGKVSISDAIKLTIATHPQILQDFANQLASQQDINQAKGGLLPTLDLNAGIGPENSNNPGTRAAGLGDVTLTRKESQALLQQLLFDGGNVTNKVREASATYEVNAYLVDQAKEILSYDAANAYLNVLRQRQLVEVYTYDAEAHRILLNKIVRRLQAGAGTKSDVELAQGRLAQAEAQVTQSEGDLANANDTYMNVIGIYPKVNMMKPLVPMHLPGSLEQAQTLGMNMSPNIQGSLAQIAVEQAAVGVAKSAFYPTVTANATKHYDDNLAGVPGADQEGSVMVRATYNVFRGGSDVAAVSAANYRLTAAIDQARLTKRDVAFAIAQAWDELIAKLDQIRNLTIHEKQSYNVWQAYIKQFQLGQRTLWDMLNAQSEYYDAQVSVVNATYDAMSARYQLLASIGALAGTITNPSQDVFMRQPLVPKIMPGETHPAMVPQVGTTVPAPTIHLPNIN